MRTCIVSVMNLGTVAKCVEGLLVENSYKYHLRADTSVLIKRIDEGGKSMGRKSPNDRRRHSGSLETLSKGQQA